MTLRAYRPAPATIELSYQPLPWRLFRTALALAVFWGAIPVLIWVPPHYPWVALSFAFVVLAMVYALGHVSGAHLNPAVTVAFASVRRFPGPPGCAPPSPAGP